MAEPRYDMRWGRQVCLDCGAHVEIEEAHTRFHAILNDTARAAAVLTVAHITASTHDRYEAFDKIQAGRNRNNWSAEAFAEVAALPAPPTPEAESPTPRPANVPPAPQSPYPGEPWRWNQMVPLTALCSSCDGKARPDPDCDLCFGSGRYRDTWEPPT